MNKEISLHCAFHRPLIVTSGKLVPPAKVENRKEDHDDVNIELHCGVDVLFRRNRVFFPAHYLQDDIISRITMKYKLLVITGVLTGLRANPSERVFPIFIMLFLIIYFLVKKFRLPFTLHYLLGVIYEEHAEEQSHESTVNSVHYGVAVDGEYDRNDPEEEQYPAASEKVHAPT